jgi:choline transport protein
MLTSVDYCIVAFAIIIIISTIQWFVDGRKNFTGPRHDVNMEVLDAVQSEQNDPEDGGFKKVDNEDPLARKDDTS